jgi:hypothetical protein
MRPCLKKNAAFALLLTFPMTAFCDLTGTWNVVRIIKNTALQTNAPGARPERDMDIVQTTYTFNSDGTVTTAGGNRGTWREGNGRFSISFDKAAQAANLAQVLTNQGFQVHGVKILQGKVKGSVYNRGIIGEAIGIYILDYSTPLGRYKGKVTVNFTFGGFKAAATAQ